MISTSKFVAALIKAFVLVASSFALESIEFGYMGSNGPDKWGSLNPGWKICNSGSRQSPINIVTSEAKRNDHSLKALTSNFVDANATLINNDFNIELKFESEAGTVMVEGKNYSLQNLHWHSPSEHTINGKRYPVELHLVHKSNDGGVAVVAVLYKFGKADAFLSGLKDGFKELAEERVSKESKDEEGGIAVGVVRANELKLIERVKYYRYAGSLTVPPCTENVIWSIMGRVREMTREQADALKAPLLKEFKSNSRPTQLLNARTVQIYSRHHDNRDDKFTWKYSLI